MNDSNVAGASSEAPVLDENSQIMSNADDTNQSQPSSGNVESSKESSKEKGNLESAMSSSEKAAITDDINHGSLLVEKDSSKTKKEESVAAGGVGNNTVSLPPEGTKIEMERNRSENSKAVEENKQKKVKEATKMTAAASTSSFSDDTYYSIPPHSEPNSRTASTTTEDENNDNNKMAKFRKSDDDHDKRTKFRKSDIDTSETIHDKLYENSSPSATTAAEEEEKNDRIRLGICAMEKKARSKPMAEILSRLDENLFEVVFFGDHVILNEPIEEWPLCDVVIAFFSKGYPLHKAKEYVKLRKPCTLNDLETQELLMDRRRVYDLLEASGIDVPRHVYLSRDGYVSTGTGGGNGAQDQAVQEFDDHIEVNGVVINKPFVEKPVDAEDHNISIYYPTSAGGGCKKLFRKIGNRSSEFYPDVNEVRRDGSYIYEEFVETQGTDVKMYTVGPEYGHAEARKSPTVDGKVQRNSDGKEVRFPVILTFREKEIARRIVLVFKQFVCGFDILRVQEGHAVVSYVCDVNGWSFVKNSRKYYDDCAQILTEHICALMKPAALRSFSTLDPLVTRSLAKVEEPKEEKKPKTFLSRAAQMLKGEPAEDDDDDEEDEKSAGTTINESPTRDDTGNDAATINSSAATLVDGAVPVREFPSNLTVEPASISANSSVQEKEAPNWSRSTSDVQDEGTHQEELRCVLAIIRHGDRTPKQKLKVNMSEPHILEYFHKHVKDCRKDLKVKAKTPLTQFLEIVKTTLDELRKERSADTERLRYQLMHMRDILERWKIVGLNRKLQIKPRKFEEYTDANGEIKTRCTEVQLILKWGGNLTRLGEKQAINLGRRLRVGMYPDAPGGGILRLHSTFRHDLKIKTSDEGRVMKTAAAFAKGLLELEGDLPPILVSLVHKEKGSMHMLDPSGNKEVKMELDECKARITEHLQKDIDVADASEEELEELFGPKDILSIRTALQKIGNPRKMLIKIHDTMGELIRQLEDMLDSMGSGDERRIEGGEGLKGEKDEDFALSGVKLYKGETLLELTERWRFIYDRICTVDDDNNMKFDLSRIPDIHDNVRFDMLHNPHLGLAGTLERLYEMAKLMADCVVPQEYGTKIEEKRSVGVKICRGLLEKIKFDLGVARTDNEVDMRYMINMDYSADLPINTMGRRIRTRLYFTSESHLHTVLNVLRFGSSGNSYSNVLSKEGIEFINNTPELCYLTQIVIRVFEDNRLKMANDPRRYRIEILFSPGATATPLHLQEPYRDLDTSRFDTAPLQMIGRVGLTCEELEAFFDEAIQAGKSEETDDDMSYSTLPEKKKSKASSKPLKPNKVSNDSLVNGMNAASEGADDDGQRPTAAPLDSSTASASKDNSKHAANRGSSDKDGNSISGSINDTNVQSPPRDSHKRNWDWELLEKGSQQSEEEEEEKLLEKRVSRKYFWGTVAIGSFTLGVSCLLFAFHLNDTRNVRRWPSSRRY